jgi:hypothetical protein
MDSQDHTPSAPVPEASKVADRIWSAGVALLVVGILVRFAADTIADPDLWGHVRFGQLTMALGGVSRFDPFSYLSAGHPWINHEWLSEVVFARVWDASHTPGLVALKTGMVLLVLMLVYRHLCRSGLGVPRAGAILLGVGLPSLIGLGTIRPQMFTYLLFVVTLLIIEAAEEGRSRWLWLLPVVFAVWVNLHGGVLAGVGVLGLWSASRVAITWLDHRRGGPSAPGPPLKLVLGISVMSVAALLLNPYGPGLPLFLLRTATGARPDISEWQQLSLRSILGALWLTYLAFTAWTLWRTPRRRRPALLVLLGVLALLPLTAIRHLPLFALAVAILLARDLAANSDPATGAGRFRPPRKGLALGLGALAGVVGVLVVVRSASDLRCIKLGAKGGVIYPARAIGLLERSGARGKLAIYFDWGEYAIWKLEPGLRVGMDGRRETVYADSVYGAYLNWQNGLGDWDRYLGMGPADLALVPRDKPVYNLLSLSPGWPRLYQDTLVALFGREGSPALERVRTVTPPDLPVDGEGLCFP